MTDFENSEGGFVDNLDAKFGSKLWIAVVIVTFKSAELTIQCLRALEAERSAAGFAVTATVVDNDSGDFDLISRAIEVNNWSTWAQILAAPRNGGFGYGNNLGMRHVFAKGAPSYIYLLNPDAQVRSGAVGSLVRFLENHPDIGIAGGSFETMDGSEWPTAFRFPTLISELCQGLQISLATRLFARWIVPRHMGTLPEPVDWICGASMMIRSTVIAAIGGFDENYFLYFEETEFCLRARRANFTTWYVPESRVMHMMGQSTAVTDERGGLKRLPGYWFESRRRYFAMTFGPRRAQLIDVVAVIAGTIGLTKRTVLRRPSIPYFIRDLIHHSVIQRKNRVFPPINCFYPRG